MFWRKKVVNIGTGEHLFQDSASGKDNVMKLWRKYTLDQARYCNHPSNTVEDDDGRGYTILLTGKRVAIWRQMSPTYAYVDVYEEA